MSQVVAAGAPRSTRVISYTRFSTRKQVKGLSYIRQVEAARAWCANHGYTLDESDEYKDLGVSAYSGANAETGDLAELQRRLHSGDIPRGTILIVEALDRLTRQALPKAITLLMNLATSGLRVVTLADGKVWDEESMHDLGSFMLSVVTLYRGHQESEYKSMRLRATFKKHRVTGSQQAFGSAPGWLSREAKDKPWVVDEVKAEVVRKVFELAANGYGSKAIAKKANEEGWVVPMRLNATDGRWHGQMPGQLLRNRAVLGEHQHRVRTYEAKSQHWQGLATGAPVRDYYPRIVSDEQWFRARASVRARASTKRRDLHFYNVFSGMMYCGHCGAPIHRKNERDGYSRAQLQCSDRVAGRTECRTMSANCADPHILAAIYEYALGRLQEPSSTSLDEEVEALESAIAEKQEESQRLVLALSMSKTGNLPLLVERMDSVEGERKALQQQLDELREKQLASIPTGAFGDSFIADAMRYLYVSGDEDAKEKRALLHMRLAKVVDTIWLWSYDLALIRYKGDNVTHPVMLGDKRLPSRAKPGTKWHKPPKPREPMPKPFYWSTLGVGASLVLPEPRRPAVMAKKLNPLYLGDEMDEGEEGAE